MELRRIGLSLVKLITPLTIAMIPGMAFAQQNYYSESNKTVQFVGVQGNSGYVSFTTPTTAGCAWGNVYFDITTDAGKAALSVHCKDPNLLQRLVKTEDNFFSGAEHQILLKVFGSNQPLPRPSRKLPSMVYP